MITELSSKAEVAQFDDARFGDENVFWLYISMNTLNINNKCKRLRHV